MGLKRLLQYLLLWSYGFQEFAVIASDIGGLSDIFEDGSNGLLVPDGNVGALEKAILKLLNNFSLYDTISKNSVKNAFDNYSYVSRN